MSGYKAIIWDWNGTLLDDVELCVSIANEILDERGLPRLTHERYREIFDFPVRRYWERTGFDFSRTSFERLSARFCARFDEKLSDARLHPGARKVLRFLESKGLSQHLLSGTEHKTLSRMAEHYALSTFFDSHNGMPNTLAEGKVELGRGLMGRLELAPQRTLMIGDTAHDAEVARALGADCILLAVGHHSEGRLAEQGVPVVTSFERLGAVIASRLEARR